MERQTRSKRFMIRVKPIEWQWLVRESSERAQTPSEYVRAVVFSNAVLVVSDDRK